MELDTRSLLLGATAGLSLAALYSYTSKRSEDEDIGSADTESTSNDANFEFARGGSLVPFPSGAPRLRREDMTIAGCSFIGLNLSRNHSESPGLMSHPDSVSRQTQFDFNLIQDRAYTYFSQTDDAAWLCGGGESGESYKLRGELNAVALLLKCHMDLGLSLFGPFFPLNHLNYVHYPQPHHPAAATTTTTYHPPPPPPHHQRQHVIRLIARFYKWQPSTRRGAAAPVRPFVK